MTDAAQKFDLLETYVKLDDGGSGAIAEVDDAFWQEIDARPQFQYGRLVTKARFTSDWPTWEIHPAGPELVLLLEGEVEFVIRVANRDEVVRLER
ncbi:MAG TPA: hypothetical protein VLT59_13545, partial [Steroidobacteraceae bacterium]|nr:hypothetical protein [Steroidobacteraceae bacterium]